MELIVRHYRTDTHASLETRLDPGSEIEKRAKSVTWLVSIWDESAVHVYGIDILPYS